MNVYCSRKIVEDLLTKEHSAFACTDEVDR